ncbi:MAG: class A beta-lactamase-related serine hydrolase, partial [Sphingomonadales bacterium]|nr:class A beta-lactamase-related serine hydrolase [Sphingomonadales bacterium]
MLLPLLASLAAQAAAPLASPVPLPASTPAVARTASPDLTQLQRRLEAIAEVPSGDAGFAVLDLRTGQAIGVHGDRPFPMASTVKVAIAATYLADVDAGRRTLGDMIPVDDRLRLRADGITLFAPHPGVTLSAANLIELMLTRSDNTATDVLLKNIGGPAMVEIWLQRNGIKGLRVDRTIAELLLDRRGARVAQGSTAAETLRQWDPVAPGSAPEAESDGGQPNTTFDRDPRDTATPLGYAE